MATIGEQLANIIFGFDNTDTIHGPKIVKFLNETQLGSPSMLYNGTGRLASKKLDHYNEYGSLLREMYDKLTDKINNNTYNPVREAAQIDYNQASTLLRSFGIEYIANLLKVDNLKLRLEEIIPMIHEVAIRASNIDNIDPLDILYCAKFVAINSVLQILRTGVETTYINKIYLRNIIPISISTHENTNILRHTNLAERVENTTDIRVRSNLVMNIPTHRGPSIPNTFAWIIEYEKTNNTRLESTKLILKQQLILFAQIFGDALCNDSGANSTTMTYALTPGWWILNDTIVNTFDAITQQIAPTVMNDIAMALQDGAIRYLALRLRYSMTRYYRVLSSTTDPEFVTEIKKLHDLGSGPIIDLACATTKYVIEDGKLKYVTPTGNIPVNIFNNIRPANSDIDRRALGFNYAPASNSASLLAECIRTKNNTHLPACIAELEKSYTNATGATASDKITMDNTQLNPVIILFILNFLGFTRYELNSLWKLISYDKWLSKLTTEQKNIFGTGVATAGVNNHEALHEWIRIAVAYVNENCAILQSLFGELPKVVSVEKFNPFTVKTTTRIFDVKYDNAVLNAIMANYQQFTPVMPQYNGMNHQFIHVGGAKCGTKWRSIIKSLERNITARNINLDPAAIDTIDKIVQQVEDAEERANKLYQKIINLHNMAANQNIGTNKVIDSTALEQINQLCEKYSSFCNTRLVKRNIALTSILIELNNMAMGKSTDMLTTIIKQDSDSKYSQFKAEAAAIINNLMNAPVRENKMKYIVSGVIRP